MIKLINFTKNTEIMPQIEPIRRPAPGAMKSNALNFASDPTILKAGICMAIKPITVNITTKMIERLRFLFIEMTMEEVRWKKGRIRSFV